MNIQLYFENQEVELTDKTSFTLNKSFENLWNPTDIIVEYSKSVKIPATTANNRLMANAYRIDRQFAINNNTTNVGLYLDPLKRIPMKLIYNGSVILDGYAKYTSSTVNTKETYYTFNLYGALGDVFHTLLDCVVDENRLTDEQKAEPDGGARYVIDCPWESRLIDKDFVKESWLKSDPNLDYSTDPHDYIGLAPAYRGLYSDFESNSALGLNWYSLLDGELPTEAVSVEDELKKRWKNNLMHGRSYTAEQADARIDALDYSVIIPKGLSEHNMKQFRAYEQKPYIYMHGLMKMYREKCKELTGYTINLDPSWFSINNPYWSKMCYMLDYLSVKGNTLQTALPFTGYVERQYTSNYTTTATYEITDNEILSKGDIRLMPFTVCAQNRISGVVSDARLALQPNVELMVDITLTTNGKSTTYKYWGGVDYERASAPNGYPKENFILVADTSTYNDGVVTGRSYITVPSVLLKHNAGDSVTVAYKFTVNAHNAAGTYYGWRLTSSTKTQYIAPQIGSSDNVVLFPNVEYESNWRNSTTCELKNLYTKEESLFNVVLQYTKMFGLIWKPDYQNKTIDIVTRATYFKDYEVADWSDKVDKSKGLTIEPVSFGTKYVTFNYDDIDGYRYTGYRNKYGVDYGEKKIHTKYNFDTRETALFDEKIGPSSVSCQSFSTIYDLKSWDTITTVPETVSDVNYIDCTDDNQESAISINNWYFRCANKEVDTQYRITDVSDQELEQGKYFWVGNGLADYYGISVDTDILPQFSPVYKSEINGLTIGCLFNCPNEDYTKDQQIVNAKGQYIYDICWDKYINERYNANNKKVTCYVKMTPIEFQDFNYKKFVTVDNQLFVVNKIFDYEVNTKMTKVELIQVTDITGYTEQKLMFPYATYSANELYISTSSDAYGTYGSGQLQVRVFPALSEIATITAAPVVVGSSRSTITDIETEYYGEYITNVVFSYESDGTYTEEWELLINYNNGDIKKIPIYIND